MECCYGEVLIARKAFGYANFVASLRNLFLNDGRHLRVVARFSVHHS